MVLMSKPELMLKKLGEPLVRTAFNELLASDIPSENARQIIEKFSEKWKDYARPALMKLVCEAVGGDPKLVEPVAKAMVLIAGAFDIHDDIIDKSYVRTEKRKKTLLSIHGSDTMLLIGDALMIGGLTYLPLLNRTLPDKKVMRIIETIRSGLFELGSAELEELKLIHNYQTTPEQYLKIVRMKAADVESYAKIGAIIGGANEDVVSIFAEFGRLLGMITILRDDINDTFNDKRELVSRITNESLPLPIVFSLSDLELVKLLKTITPQSSKHSLETVLKFVDQYQGFERTKTEIEKRLDKIKTMLNKIKGTEKISSTF
jgi:geranylgeranyl diphosphate synthase type I